MTASAQSHSRSHSLLLLQKLLNLRDGASPLTLLLDTLEQTAQPLVSEFITRAKISKSKVIFLSFSTLRKPKDVDIFVRASGQSLKHIRDSLLAHFPPFDPAAVKDKTLQRAVVVIDSLNSLSTAASSSLAPFLSSILTPAVSIVAVYHTDVPLVLPPSFSEYEPEPLTVLCHLATAILRVSSLRQEMERKAARDRALVEPEWGLKEPREGVIVGLMGTASRERDSDSREAATVAAAAGAVVLEMELRRRSGRIVSGRFVLSRPSSTDRLGAGRLSLLADHPAFAAPVTDEGRDGEGEGGESGRQQEQPESTFSLGLTEKQRRDREGIVLPYFDAQTDIGAGEGGRILYEMGREDLDDFDDEEDEI